MRRPKMVILSREFRRPLQLCAQFFGLGNSMPTTALSDLEAETRTPRGTETFSQKDTVSRGSSPMIKCFTA